MFNPRRWWTLAVSAVVLASSSFWIPASGSSTPNTTFLSGSALDAAADALLDKLTPDDVLGLMTQIDITALLTNDSLDEAKLRSYSKLRVGSFFDSPFGGGMRGNSYGYTVTQWREVITKIQKISMEENGGHPILFGLDSVHGAIYVRNATLFGQQINAAATFNPSLVYEMGRITGKDTLAAGVPWIFGPILEVSQNPLWARTFETFGEDPYTVSVMGDAIVRGLQSTKGVAACMKHFLAYSKTTTGHDRAPVTITDFDLLNYFAPPFLAAVKAGVKSAMENYISINGVPVVASDKIINRLLRRDMGFDGLVVTDWAEVNNLQRFHRLVRTERQAVELALSQTTIDMSMVPDNASFIDHAKEVLEYRPEYYPRMKQSARRLLKAKLELGLYNNPVPGAEFVDTVGSAADQQVALNLARESIVLLKNDRNILPLKTDASIFITGHGADNIGHLCGGWSLRWQGYSGNDMFLHGVSFKQGLEKLAAKNKISHLSGVKVDGTYSDDELTKAKAAAKAADYTIVVIGEGPYAEKPGDIGDLALPAGQVKYVRELVATGVKVIVVLVGGRPRLLNGLPADVPVVVNAMLPCEAGGQALAEIVYGIVNPSGRLPITYPRDAANIMIPYNAPVSVLCADSKPCQAEWEFGSGLSYTTFAYSPVKLSQSIVTGKNDSIVVSFNVTNTGSRVGKETVMLFVIQPYRLISIPERKQLKKFTKIELRPGQTSRVNFTLTAEDWSVYRPQIGEGFLQWAEAGEFVVAVKPETDCDVYNDAPAAVNPLCASFTLLPEYSQQCQV